MFLEPSGIDMDGMGLLKDLAQLERELKEKLDETYRSAEARIARAEDEARRILNDAEAQIRRMSDVSKEQVAEECEMIAQESGSRAEAEARRIREQAEPHIDRAVDFILSKVLP
jgi:V/A-type H+-transporting ATPase subunit G/H